MNYPMFTVVSDGAVQYDLNLISQYTEFHIDKYQISTFSVNSNFFFKQIRDVAFFCIKIIRKVLNLVKVHILIRIPIFVPIFCDALVLPNDDWGRVNISGG